MTAAASSPVSKEEARASVGKLVEKFRSTENSGEAARFNEAQVRISFINPLLKALGWNVESPEEVTVEDHLLQGYSDYALRLPGERRPKIFVEAKKFELGPKGLDGHTERGGRQISFPQQAVQYAWQTQADWSILTNFKETRLYSSYIDPKDPESGLTLSIKVEDYESKFDDLWVLSQESAATGALDSKETRRARETIHVEAPADLFEIRGTLAVDIHRLNPELELERVREATQRIIDRLMVMRAAEDRGVLPSEALWRLYQAWKDTQIDPSALFIRSLRHQFQQFDKVYNSEMFAPGHVCDSVSVSNAAIESALNTLYDYNFDLIDADILGSIYEGYLGYVLKEEKGELKFRREDKSRKKHGVYYTPTYVVEYIVDRTLGPLLTSADPGMVSKVRVLDPACGSGSFLIKSFDRFAQWYVAYNQLQLHAAKGRVTLADHASREDEIHGFRERVLHENLFGVDLDPQAAEIAAINLLLKGLRKNQKLPLILRENIKVGNSLVSGDEAELKKYFGDKWEEKRPFNWNVQFPFLQETGGFDVVLGNPPYVDSRGIPEEEREYFHDSTHGRALPFPTTYKKTDLYALFIELGLRLLKPGGRLSFIIPDRFLYSPYAGRLREHILNTCAIEEIVDLSNVRVFLHQSVWNVIIVLRKEADSTIREANRVRVGVVPESYPISEGIPEPGEEMNQTVFSHVPDFQFRLQLRKSGMLDTVRRMESAGRRLDSIYYVNWGLRTGTEEKTERLVTKDGSHPLAKKMVRGENIVDRYLLQWSGEFITYDREQLYNPLFKECLDSPKIVVRKISGSRGLFASYDSVGFYPFSTVIIALPYWMVESAKQARVPEGAALLSKEFDPLYVLAVLNSRATRFYFDAMVTDGLSVVPEHLNQLPIPPAPTEVQGRIADHARRLIQLRSDLAEEEKVASFRRIAATIPRSAEDNLSLYFAKFDERGLEVRNRLDSVSRASRITVTPKLEGEWLNLNVDYRERTEPSEKHGTVRCRFPGPLNEFVAYSIRDLETPEIGSGRLMSKVRSIRIPRFHEDWDKHVEIVGELVHRLSEHRARIESLSNEISRIESEIDREVYRLFRLETGDIGRIEST